MRNTMKLVAGILLFGASALCVLLTYGNVSQIRASVREDVESSMLGSILEAKEIEAENLGQRAVTEWGEELIVQNSEYEFYRLAIQVENKGYGLYFANPAKIFTVHGELSEDVGRVVYFDVGFESFFDVITPVAPGKTCTTATPHVEVRSGVHALEVVYAPAWNEDEQSLPVLLD